MIRFSTWIRWIFVGFISLALTIGCTPQPNATAPSSSPPAESQPLVSATNNWVGYSGHHVAVGKGFYTQAGLKVQDLFFQSAGEEITAFLAGKIDIAWVASGDVIQMVEKDPSIKIIYHVDYSNGSDGIIGRNINSPADAKGKTIARENILFERVLLQAYLKKGGLTESDATVKDIASADAATAFAAKQVDIAVTYEPYMSKAASQGGGKVIFSTKDTNLIADVIIVRDKLIQTRKTDLEAYLKASDKAIKLLIANDPEALKLSGAKLGVTADEIKEQLGGVKLFDLEMNKTVSFNKTDVKSMIGNLELTSKAAYDFKIVSKPIQVESLYDDAIVKGS